MSRPAAPWSLLRCARLRPQRPRQQQQQQQQQQQPASSRRASFYQAARQAAQEPPPLPQPPQAQPPQAQPPLPQPQRSLPRATPLAGGWAESGGRVGTSSLLESLKGITSNAGRRGAGDGRDGRDGGEKYFRRRVGSTVEVVHNNVGSAYAKLSRILRESDIQSKVAGQRFFEPRPVREAKLRKQRHQKEFNKVAQEKFYAVLNMLKRGM